MMEGAAMEGLHWSLDTTLMIGAMSVPSKTVRFDPADRAISPPVIRQRAHPTDRLSGLPRLGEEIVDGIVARR
jgi:hypothetical protein